MDTSSCGRLFDAVSALLKIRLESKYEGQAAIELEAVAAAGIAGSYPFDFDGPVIDFRQTIRSIAADREQPQLASARFHNTVAAAIVEACRRSWRQEGLDRVCLSGGSFQNLYLLRRTVELLRADGFQVLVHSKVPPNDGGLCLGQAGNHRQRCSGELAIGFHPHRSRLKALKLLLSIDDPGAPDSETGRSHPRNRF